MARRSRYNRKRRQGRFSFLYKVLVFAAICGAIAVALALFFKVETISVVGNSRYSADQIVEAGGISPGGNMFFLNKYNASEKITSALPYIETVRISRQLPGTLTARWCCWACACCSRCWDCCGTRICSQTYSPST